MRDAHDRDGADELVNPVWTALATAHRAFAVGAGAAVRYRPDGAPFLAVAEPCALAADVLDALVGDGTALVLGPRPTVPAGWTIDDFGPLDQLTCDHPLDVPDGPPVALLVDADRPALLALVALVYPHYFRPRTPELGRYHGIRSVRGLDALIGERMALPGRREISAVCTHPDAAGRGHARRLLAHATNAIFARGEAPFLHVAKTNARAIDLYLQNGYRRSRDMPFCAVRRATTGDRDSRDSRTGGAR